jgi:hypothetical protein
MSEIKLRMHNLATSIIVNTFKLLSFLKLKKVSVFRSIRITAGLSLFLSEMSLGGLIMTIKLAHAVGSKHFCAPTSCCFAIDHVPFELSCR